MSNCKHINFDLLIWKTIISQSLKDIHGIYGDSLHYDILTHDKNYIIIRSQKQDKLFFINGFLSYIFDLKTFFNIVPEISNIFCSINIEKSSNLLSQILNEECMV